MPNNKPSLSNNQPVNDSLPPAPDKKSKKVWWILGVVLILIIAGLAIARPQPPAIPSNDESGLADSQNGPVSSRNNKNGPYYHQIYSARSTDGLTWELDNKLLFDHASVPGAAFRDGIIYLYFVDASGEQDQMSMVTSTDQGQTFSDKQRVKIEGVKPYDAVDPSPEVVDGKIRLYYLGDFMSQTGSSRQFIIYSADSTDGVNFTDSQPAYAFDEMTTDPDVFRTSTGFRILVSQGTKLQYLTSTDGRTFTLEKGFDWNLGAVSDTNKFGDVYRTYFCGQGIQSATGADSGKLVAEAGTRVEVPGKITCDPSVIAIGADSYLMFYKTQTATSQSPDNNLDSVKTLKP